MNISYKWLKDYLKFDLSPQETADALTSIGLETGTIEEYQSVKGGLKGLVTGHVLTCIDHPNSDHLHITTVDVGGDEPLKIVCGAANIAAGQNVVVATIGSKLFFGDDEVTIKRSKIRGEESFGMICGEDEIGVGKSHDGIIVLPENVVPGTLVAEYYNVESDYVLEVDITPNRVDATSHYGVARDLAAYLQQAGKKFTLTRPSVDSFAIDKKEGALSVKVEDLEGAPRYSGLTIKGVEINESPEWLKQRLSAIGLRPINNIVDITNFVLHETGHPLHAFDADMIEGGEVIVKNLPEGTKFVTLDEQERTLSSSDLMICNAKEGMCIAGVFGGLKSGVTDNTTNVFLESAYFNPTRIRKSARRHGLNTDSSFRFERGVDANNTLYVLKRAAILIKELAGGEICGDVYDNYPQEIPTPLVELFFSKVDSLIGKHIEKETIKSILKSLEMEIKDENDERLLISIPTYRVDVLRDVDVIEDILRLYGYNNVEISDKVKSNLSYQKPTDRKHKMQTLISEQLTGCGFREILNNSLTPEAYYTDLESYLPENCVKLLNPLSNDLNVMRQTLLFGGLESIAYNRNRKNLDLRFYEFGNSYKFDASKKIADSQLAEFSEDFRIAIWICGKQSEKSWAKADQPSSVFELKAYVENIFLRLGILERISCESFSNDIYSSALRFKARERELGTMGIVRSKLVDKFEIDTDVYYAELSWDKLMAESDTHQVKYSEVSKFPSVSRDLALLIDKSVKFEQIVRIARNSEKKLLKDITLFDVYEGKILPEGKKSYAVNFVLQNPEKTLNDKQIDSVMQKIQLNLEKELGAKLR